MNPNAIQSNTSLTLKRCLLKKILNQILSALNQGGTLDIANLNLKIKYAELEAFVSRWEGEIALKYRILELILQLQIFLRFGHSNSAELKERINRLLNDIGKLRITWREPKEHSSCGLLKSRFRSLESLRMRSASLALNGKKPKEREKNR